MTSPLPMGNDGSRARPGGGQRRPVRAPPGGRIRRRVPRTRPDDYPALFAWDSGYHALAMRHFDPSSPATELSTLYRSNLRPDGLLSHQRFVPGADDVQALVEDLFGPMFDGDRTPFVDPPTAAYAAARLSLSGTASADHLLDFALGHLRALGAAARARRRPPPGDPSSVRDGHRRQRLHEAAPGRHVRFVPGSLQGPDDLGGGGGDVPGAGTGAGHRFVVLDPTMCGWYLLALEEVAGACHALGRTRMRSGPRRPRGPSPTS